MTSAWPWPGPPFMIPGISQGGFNWSLQRFSDCGGRCEEAWALAVAEVGAAGFLGWGAGRVAGCGGWGCCGGGPDGGGLVPGGGRGEGERASRPGERAVLVGGRAGGDRG